MIPFKRPVNAVLLLGPTGSGKSPLGDCLERKGLHGRRFLHFDFGEQLRAVASSPSPPVGFDAGEHCFVRGVLEKGLLLEKEHFPIALKVVDSFLRRNHFEPDDTLVLNGLPRHVGQAQDMDAVAAVGSVVVLECSPGDTQKRICTNIGGDRTARTDDDIEMVRRKLEIYRKRTAPLIDYYTAKKCTVVKIEVTPESTAEAIYSTLVSAGYSL
jgi:adenylate kinase